MTNETEKSCCGGKPSCDTKPAEVKTAGGCCDTKSDCGTKGGCGCGTKKCLCGKTSCCCRAMCRILAIVLIAGLAWFGWQAHTKTTAVCLTLAAGDKVPAIPAPEASMQSEVNDLQEKVVETAQEQKSIEGQYIAHLQSTLAAVKNAAGCP